MAFINLKRNKTSITFRSLHDGHAHFEPLKSVHSANEMKSLIETKVHHMQSFNSNYTNLVHLLNKRM